MVLKFFKNKEREKQEREKRKISASSASLAVNMSIMVEKLSEALIESILSNRRVEFCVSLIRQGAHVNYKSNEMSVLDAIIFSNNISLLKFIIVPGFGDTTFNQVRFYKCREGFPYELNHELNELMEIDAIDLNKYSNKYSEYKNTETLKFLMNFIHEAQEERKIFDKINKNKKGVNLVEWANLRSEIVRTKGYPV